MEDVINRKRESEEKSMSKEVISNEFLYSVKKKREREKSVWSNGIWNECRRRGSPADLFYDCCYHDFF